MKACCICHKTFESNYKSKITCSKICQGERKKKMKMVWYYSEDGYKKQRLNIQSNAHIIRSQYIRGDL
jgi:hypothetical protein